MPAGPTPIYIVTYDGDQFPGYVQAEEQPLNIRTIRQGILNRNGGLSTPHGAEVVPVSLDFIVMSELDNVTELEHLNDAKDQYHEARKIVARATAPAKLKIGYTTKYINAVPTSITAPLSAGQSRTIRYRVQFDALPYYIDETAVTDSFTGNDTVALVFAADTLETYPIFSVPNGVTAFTATHAASGKVIEFVRGTVSGTVTIDCGTFSVTTTTTDASVTMDNVNFGMKHTAGVGTMSIAITGFAGSGTVSVSAYPRYAL